MTAAPLGGNEILHHIHEGMPVLSPDGGKIGTVRQVYLGGEDLSEKPAEEDLGHVAADLRVWNEIS